MQDALNLTFDLHATQIAQLSHELGRQNPFVASNDKEIQEFCQRVQDRLDRADWDQQHLAVQEEARQLEADYHRELSSYEGWNKLFFRLEILLVVWGTIQWGYGDLLVKYWHELLG